MKTMFVSCLLFILHSLGYSQYQPYEPYYQTKSYFFDVYNQSGKKIEPNDPSHTSGSIMLNPAWGTGSVVFANGKQVSDVPLQFNIKDNALYFLKDSTRYTFAYQVSAFKMTYNDDGNSREVYFKSGYPEYKGNTSSFLYEVINDGPNVQFIKRLSVAIKELSTYALGTTQSYRITDDSYLYNVKTKELSKISNSKNSILKSLPDYTDKIENFSKDNDLNFRKDKDIDQLVTFLNQVK